MRIIISFLLIVISFNTYSQKEDNRDEHLEPINGFFDNIDEIVEYHLQIREILLKGLGDRPHLRLLCLPSNKAVYVLDIQNDYDSGKYYISFSKCLDYIWLNKKWKKVKVKKIKTELSIDSANLIIDLYKTALNQTKYPEIKGYDYDGTTYYFSALDEAHGNLTGKVWSPSPSSKSGKLVEISQNIIETLKNQTGILNFDKNLIDKIKSLKSRYE